MCLCTQSLSHVQLFATLWIIAYQATLSMELFEQEYWSTHYFQFQGHFKNNTLTQIISFFITKFPLLQHISLGDIGAQEGVLWPISSTGQSVTMISVQFSLVQSLSRAWLFETPWTAAHQASLSITNSWSSPKPMSIESVMPSNHLILFDPLLLLPSIFPSINSVQFSCSVMSDSLQPH